MKTKLITLIFCLFSVSILNCAKKSENEAIQKKNAIEKNEKTKTILNSLLQSYLPNDIHSIVAGYLNGSDTYKCIDTFQVELDNKGYLETIRSACELENNTLALGTDKGNIKILDLNSKKIIHSFKHSSEISGVRTLRYHNGKLFSNSFRQQIKIWNLTNTHECIANILHKIPLNILKICPLQDGRLACGSYDSTIFLLDPITNKFETLEDSESPSYITDLYQDQNGNLISVEGNGKINGWDLKTKTFINIRQKHDDKNLSLILILNDGSRVFYYYVDEIISTFTVEDLDNNMYTLTNYNRLIQEPINVILQLQDYRLITIGSKGEIKVFENQYHELMQPLK